MKKIWILLLINLSITLESSVVSIGMSAAKAYSSPAQPTFTKSKSLGATLTTSKSKSTSYTSGAIALAGVASNAAATHYIINLTGRTIILNFYRKGLLEDKSIWYDAKTFGPLILAGKSTTNIFDTLNYQLLPTPIDMHTNTCFKVTVDAFKFNDNKLKDPKIHGTSMPTPATSATPNDFKVTLEGDQLVITQLDTCMGIKISGAEKKQWPSAQDVAIANMSPADKLVIFQQQNIDLQNNIKKLESEIAKTSNLVKKNNRKKMIANKKEKIKKNEKTIAKLQAEILAANANQSTSATPTASNDATIPQTPEDIINDANTTQNSVPAIM